VEFKKKNNFQYFNYYFLINNDFQQMITDLFGIWQSYALCYQYQLHAVYYFFLKKVLKFRI
jgi:hypothetical protein